MKNKTSKGHELCVLEKGIGQGRERKNRGRREGLCERYLLLGASERAGRVPEGEVVMVAGSPSETWNAAGNQRKGAEAQK